MTTYRTIAATEDQVEAFVTAELAQAWTDNLLAAMEGDATAVAAGVTLKDPALDTGAATAAGTTWVGLRTAGLATGAVGSYALLQFATLTTASAGSTHAGSGLRYTNTSAAAVSGTPSGTWRLMGHTTNGGASLSTSLFLRIS